MVTNNRFMFLSFKVINKVETESEADIKLPLLYIIKK